MPGRNEADYFARPHDFSAVEYHAVEVIADSTPSRSCSDDQDMAACLPHSVEFESGDREREQTGRAQPAPPARHLQHPCTASDVLENAANPALDPGVDTICSAARLAHPNATEGEPLGCERDGRRPALGRSSLQAPVGRPAGLATMSTGGEGVR